MKPVYRTVSISRGLTLAFLCVILIALTGCERFLFYPQKSWTRTPAQLGIEYEDVQIVSADGTRLSAWWLEAYGEVRGTVVFFHGNAENISTHLGSVYWLPEKGYQVLMLDYRGYGRSEGKPKLPEVFSDIQAALDWTFAEPRTEGMPVFVLGQSLGASMSGYVVATNADLHSQLTAVVLDAAFASYRELTRSAASSYWLTWPLQYPASWTMPRKYDLIDYIAQISPTPLLIIHGTEDQVVPFTNAEELFSVARDPKNFLQYDGPHIETFRDLELRQMVLDFFTESTQRSQVSD